MISAQRKIPVVFNCGQKNGSISGRHLVKPASGHKNGLFYGHYRHKAGIAEPFGVARAAGFEQLAGHCQLRCPALRKDLSQSEDKERLYFRIE